MPGRRAVIRPPFPNDVLRHLLIHVLRNARHLSTRRVYLSHLKSYLLFIRAHKFDPEPNDTTLALFIVYMSQFIKPTSVESYLTGITHYLLPLYPRVTQWRSTPLVHQALRGCKKLYNTPTQRKAALTIDDLNRIVTHYRHSKNHDDILFVSILLVGFFALLRLGELVYPDDPTLDSPKKMPLRSSLQLTAASLQFQLPYHKADKFFEGNTVLVKSNTSMSDPIHFMARYIISHDHRFPTHPSLWIRETGECPRRRWFLQRLRLFCPPQIAGHSLRSGGATMLAENGVSLDIIQALGHWSSDAFRTYIRIHPALLHTSIQQHRH